MKSSLIQLEANIVSHPKHEARRTHLFSQTIRRKLSCAVYIISELFQTFDIDLSTRQQRSLRLYKCGERLQTKSLNISANALIIGERYLRFGAFLVHWNTGAWKSKAGVIGFAKCGWLSKKCKVLSSHSAEVSALDFRLHMFLNCQNTSAGRIFCCEIFQGFGIILSLRSVRDRLPDSTTEWLTKSPLGPFHTL